MMSISLPKSPRSAKSLKNRGSPAFLSKAPKTARQSPQLVLHSVVYLVEEANVSYTATSVPAINPNLEDDGESPRVIEDESPRVISPFARTTSTVRATGRKGASSWALWLVSSLLILAIIGIVGYFTYKYLGDPYRTLETFPMDKYLADYRSMTGAKFKADLKVSADLGRKAETGRLMVFTVQNDTRPLVVLIPPKLDGLYFTKGQNYQASLEVGEGGLVYADSCEKE